MWRDPSSVVELPDQRVQTLAVSTALRPQVRRAPLDAPRPVPAGGGAEAFRPAPGSSASRRASSAARMVRRLAPGTLGDGGSGATTIVCRVMPSTSSIVGALREAPTGVGTAQQTEWSRAVPSATHTPISAFSPPMCTVDPGVKPMPRTDSGDPETQASAADRLPPPGNGVATLFPTRRPTHARPHRQ